VLTIDAIWSDLGGPHGLPETGESSVSGAKTAANDRQAKPVNRNERFIEDTLFLSKSRSHRRENSAIVIQKEVERPHAIISLGVKRRIG
jgi:hypothetical protein